jgi:hypothetical protein
MKPEDHTVRQVPVAGRIVTLTTYRLGALWRATADNTDPGARLARAEGPSKEAAERAALDQAEALLSGRQTAPATGCSG